MAAFDNASTAIGFGANIKFTHTVSGTNTFLAINTSCNTLAGNISAVAVRTVAATQKTNVVISGGGLRQYVSTSPVTGNATISVGISSFASFAIGACSYTAIAGTNALGGASTATATGTQASLSVSCVSGNIVHAVIGGVSITGNLTVGAGYSTRFRISDGSNTKLIGVDQVATGSTVSFSYSDDTSGGFMMSGYAISGTAEVVASSTLILSLAMMGAGI